MKEPFPLAQACCAALIAALAASAVICVPFGFLAFFIFPIVYIATAATGALVGLPLYWITHRLGIARPWMAPSAGFGAAMVVPTFGLPPVGDALAPALWFGAAGIAGGLTFLWHINRTARVSTEN